MALSRSCLGRGFYYDHVALLSFSWHQAKPFFSKGSMPGDYLKLSHVDIRQPSFLSCLTLNEQRSVLFVLTCRSTVNSFTLGQLTALSLLFFALVLLKASRFSDTYAASLNYCIIS